MPHRSPTPGHRWPRWAAAAGFAAALVGFYALGLHHYLTWDYLRSHLDTLQAAVQLHLPLALAVFFLLYLAVTALSVPSAGLLSLIAGALFGRWLGMAVVSLAATLGATLAFLLSRYLLRDLIRRSFAGRLDAIDRGVERDGAYYLFTLRLVPAFPFFLINLGMGLTRMRAWTFFWVSLLGMLPGTFLYVNAGTALATLQSPRDVLSPPIIVSLALVGLVPLALRKLLPARRPQVL